MAKKEHYVSRAEFEDELKEFYETDIMSDELCLKIQKIAKGLSYSPSFINYSYREDMISDAIIKMYVALRDKKFMFSEGSSPFSYFTAIAFNEFVSRIKKEKRQHEAVTNYKERVYEEMMTDPNIVGSGHVYVKPNMIEGDEYDNEA
jgi:DNA-directed RNA polymerase specialized sigma24 family protein